MRTFHAGQDATGFIALGQFATGFIAIGQVATGVIAIGQVARGGICIGQGSIGLFTVGMGSAGVFSAAGIGVGGRGWGGVVPLVPSLGKPRAPPATVPVAEAHQRGDGWIAAVLHDHAGTLFLIDQGRTLPIKLDRDLLASARRLITGGPVPVVAHVKRIDGQLVCERVVHTPQRPYKKPGFWKIAALQFIALTVLATVFWPTAGNAVLDYLSSFSGETRAVPAPSPTKPHH